MAESTDDPAGFRSVARGPSFVPSAPAVEPLVDQPAAVPVDLAAPPAPPPSRRPTVISVLAIVVVALVVAVASGVARWQDTHVAAPAPAAPVPAYSSGPTNRIDFVSTDGRGQLIMRARSWVSDRAGRSATGMYLRLDVELVCTDGEVDYDPYLFQAFDQTGQLFDVAAEGTGGRSTLSVGTLTPGQRVRGTIAFDIPHGEITLMMNDESERPVTALTIPD